MVAMKVMCMAILRIRLCCGLAAAVSFCRFLMFFLDVSLCFSWEDSIWSAVGQLRIIFDVSFGAALVD